MAKDFTGGGGIIYKDPGENSENNEQFGWQEYTMFESYSGMYIWRERKGKREDFRECLNYFTET